MEPEVLLPTSASPNTGWGRETNVTSSYLILIRAPVWYDLLNFWLIAELPFVLVTAVSL